MTMAKFKITIEQARALNNLVIAYSELSLVWDSSGGENDWNGTLGLGGEMDDMGLLPNVSLDEAGTYLLELLDLCEIVQPD